LATLKLYRRRNGLCFICGAKWGPNHTCPDQIPLHLLEELLTALQIQDSDDMDEVQSEYTFFFETTGRSSARHILIEKKSKFKH